MWGHSGTGERHVTFFHVKYDRPRDFTRTHVVEMAVCTRRTTVCRTGRHQLFSWVNFHLSVLRQSLTEPGVAPFC